jgi:acetylornithine aminotransferase
VALAERLLELTGLDGGAFFCNSGAEANEAAIKLARRRGRARGGPDKHRIVCLEGSFHGRTLATLQATWAQQKKAPFEPLPAGFRHARPNDREALAAAVDGSTAAILLEPVQGEGGVHPLEAGFLQLARELCDRHDALLICDEVQTGIGRCGAWLASRRLGVEPDAVTLAKGLASGIPIGALVTRALDDGFAPGEHATTFGATPPVAAAALAVLDTIAGDDLLGNAERVGGHLRERLALAPGVAGVRGLGLLIAVELASGDAAGVARRLLDEEHVIVNAVSPTALRLCPPLVLTVADADRAVAAVTRALA